MSEFSERLSSALGTLAQAQDDWVIAQNRAVDANRAETACLNGVNNAQKEVDELVGGLKKKAPRDSNWARDARKPVEERA